MARLPLALAAAAALAAASLAFVLGRTAGTPEPAEQPDASVALALRVDELARRIDMEVARREDLEETLAGMAAELAARGGAPAEPGVSIGEAAAGEGGEPPTVDAEPSGNGFDPESLVEAGFARRDAEEYAAILDDVAMRRLALRDQAVREGWLRTARFAEESRALNEELEATRETFGEDFYDWARYEAGLPNRLRVGGVLADSPAAEVGLEAGDVVQRYAEARVLAVEELRELTTFGAAGETTAIEVLRDGELLRLYVPRGPLGVRLEPIRQRPASSR